MKYQFDDLDRAILDKCKEGVAYLKNGDPLRDVMDSDDIEDAIRLLVELAKFHGELK